MNLPERTPPSQGGCGICWLDEEHGLLIKDDSPSGAKWVHQHCLDFFGVGSFVEFERQYIDTDEVHEMEQPASDPFTIDDE